MSLCPNSTKVVLDFAQIDNPWLYINSFIDISQHIIVNYKHISGKKTEIVVTGSYECGAKFQQA